jgi:hypothetical protein
MSLSDALPLIPLRETSLPCSLLAMGAESFVKCATYSEKSGRRIHGFAPDLSSVGKNNRAGGPSIIPREEPVAHQASPL